MHSPVPAPGGGGRNSGEGSCPYRRAWVRGGSVVSPWCLIATEGVAECGGSRRPHAGWLREAPCSSRRGRSTEPLFLLPSMRGVKAGASLSSRGAMLCSGDPYVGHGVRSPRRTSTMFWRVTPGVGAVPGHCPVGMPCGTGPRGATHVYYIVLPRAGLAHEGQGTCGIRKGEEGARACGGLGSGLTGVACRGLGENEARCGA